MPARMENSLFAFILFPINQAAIEYTASPKRPPAAFVSTSVISEHPTAKIYCIVSNKKLVPAISMKDKELRKLIGSRAKQRRLELNLTQPYVAEDVYKRQLKMLT